MTQQQLVDPEVDEMTCPDCKRDGFDCQCPPVCEHGSPLVEEFSCPGFTGATIWFARFEDGCEANDLSADTLEAVR